MKYIVTLSFIAAFIFSQNAQAQFQYVSPIAGAKLVNPEHNIIIREGRMLDPSSLHENLFTIEGSKSGIHTFKMVLCLDGKTINLNLATPFDFEENVTVNIKSGLKTTSGETVIGYSFSFTTHREWTESEKLRMKNFRKNQIQRELESEGYAGEFPSGDTRTLTGLIDTIIYINPAPGDIYFNTFSAKPGNVDSTFYGWHFITPAGDSIFSRYFPPAGDLELTRKGYFAGYRQDYYRFDIMDSNFAVVDSYYAANGYEMDDHDFILEPDGMAVMIDNDYFIFDMTVYDASYSPNATMRGSVIQVFDADKNVLFEWRGYDFIDFFEANWEHFSTDEIDFIHANSLYLDDNGTTVISSLRHLDQIIKLDLGTGDFVWRCGGDSNQFTFINDPTPFNYQHDARKIANGHLTVFNNNNHPITGIPDSAKISSAREYSIDEVNKTITLLWQYKHLKPSGNGYNYYQAQGAVQRLENGNTFIDWGWRLPQDNMLPSMSEVTSDGTIVWELRLNSALNMCAYRARKVIWNPCNVIDTTSFATNNISTDSADLSWALNSKTTDYILAYKLCLDANWTSVPLDTNFVTIENLFSGSCYEWRVQSICPIYGDTFSYYPTQQFYTELAVTLEEALNPVSSFIIYPNPTSATTDISFNATSDVLIEITITDLTGKEK